MNVVTIEAFGLSAAIACLAVAAIIHLASHGQLAGRSGRWWNAQRGAEMAALFCAAVALGSASVPRGEWPLTTAAEMVVASAASALLWRLLHRRADRHAVVALLLYAITAGLLIWPTVRRLMRLPAYGLGGWPQPGGFLLHLLLALAFGAFIEAGSLALVSLFRDWRGKRHGNTARDTGQSAAHLGFALLTASLLIRAVLGQYTSGIPWSWSASESWQAILFLWYAIHWCASVLLGWRRWPLWTLQTLGLVLTLATLSRMGR